MRPWLWAMQDADEAECRGDAAGALEAINRRRIGPDGQVYWRPSRIRWLEQMVMLGSSAPGWVRSRWILAQALQHLDERDRGAGGRRARAVSIAAEIRGGLHRVRGRDADDRRIQVMDHDWIHRQTFLYDLQGLRRFLREGATPDLVAGADRIREWADAPMGGFRFVESTGDSLLWLRAGEGWSTVRTPNVGTAFALEPGDHVLGRLVPIEGGVIFDGPVLPVPSTVARDVERDPARWLDVLRGAADDVRAGRIDPHRGGWRGLVSDIPFDVVDLVLLRDDPLDHEAAFALASAVPAAERARSMIDLAGNLRLREILLEALEQQGEDVSEVDDLVDCSALVHGALSDPAIVAALPEVIGPDDRIVLDELCGQLAEPARTIVASLLGRLDAAA